MEWTLNGFIVTSDPRKVDRRVVADFLADSYCAQGISAATVNRSIDGSICFSLLEGERQIGFARVISDRATIAYLGDVFVLPGFRGRGLGKWLMKCVLSYPELRGLRRWILVTRDAHGLYEQLGFKALSRPESHMELHDPNVYRSGA
jgi:GNAT superfamily N-acetyltransferase